MVQLVGNEERDISLYYTVNDITGKETLSSYALNLSPLTFIPKGIDSLPSNFSDKRIVWDFGDGTVTETITAKHSYTTPGKYRIKSYIYDNFGVVYRNSYSEAIVEIRDYVEDKIVLDIETLKCGVEHLTSEIKDPITITQYNSRKSFEKNNNNPSPVITYVEPKTFDIDYGYFNKGLDKETYGHLIPTYRFLQNINNIETVPISSVQIYNYDSIYAYLSGSTILTSTDNLPGSEFAGVSSTNEIFFVSDIPGTYNLVFGFEQDSLFDCGINTTTYGTSAKICENLAFERLNITSNGIDGENFNLDVFNINKVKYECTKIPFVIQVKDNEGFSQRAVPLLELESESGICLETESVSEGIFQSPTVPILTELPTSPIGEEYCISTEGSAHLPLSVVLTDGTTVYNATIRSDIYSISSLLVPGYYPGYAGGFFKGYFSIETDEVIEDVWIEATTIIDQLILSGTSTKFNIYPKEYYIVAKQGEDVNFTEVFEDISTQPLFSETKVLMKDFLGSLFGDITSAQTTLGKSTYEKIENFVDNNAIIDYANIDQLASILQSYNLPKINKYTTPSKVKRLLDLLSISMSRLFGDINQNRDDFNSFGYPANDCYGIDRCTEIPKNGIVFAGHEIIAFEKFSGKWTTLNTMLPLSASSAPELKSWYLNPINGFDITQCFGGLSCNPLQTESFSAVRVESEYMNICLEGEYEQGVFSSFTKYYQLSDYNQTWGWPLVLDADGSFFDLYNFYYKSSYEKDVIEGSVINFKDQNTTINTNYTYDEWARPNGVMSNIIANSLYSGLELFDCELP